MADPTQQSRLLSLTTVLGANVLVIERLAGKDALGRPFELTLQAGAKNDDFKVDDLVGTKVSVKLMTAVLEGAPERWFSGIVSQVDHIGFDVQGLSRYELVIVPWLWLLTRTSDCRIFQNLTVPEIIQKVFADLPIADFRLDLKAQYPQREYCVQYRETDFNFVQRLMEHEGIYYFWEHKEDSHTMVICDHMSSHKPVDGFHEVRYRSEFSGIQEEFVLRSWQAQHRVTPGKYAINSFDFKAPKPSPNTKLLSRSDKQHAFKEGEHELYDNPGDYVERPDGERLAAIRREEIQCQTHTITSRTTATGLFTGCTFKSKEIPKKDQNAEYLIISSTFTISAGNYESEAGSSEDTYLCDLTGILADGVFRPERTALATRIEGPQTAIVSGPEGEEIHVDEFGRVKVQFLWDREGKFDAGSSCWIRVSQVWAGKGWGAMHIPRIGQEVIVDFLEGDPDRPIITGKVYNAVQTPPYALPAEKTKSTLKSNSSKGSQGFNEIRMEDKKGSEQLFIHAEKNQDIRVKNDRFETIGNNRHLVVEKDKFEHVKNNRDEIVDATHKEKIGADRNLTVGGKQAVAIGGSNSITVKGDMIEVFKANHSETTSGDVYIRAANIVIEGGTNVTLKVGGSWLAIEADGVKMSGPTVTMEGTAMADIHAPAVKIN